MLEYYVYDRREYGRPVGQCVFYIGAEPLRMSPVFEEGGTTHRFEIVNLQDYAAEQLLASPDWGDVRSSTRLSAKRARSGTRRRPACRGTYVLLNLLTVKFGSSVPDWARERVGAASSEQIQRWALRLLRAESLDDTLA